jgi:uncharacterized protein
VGRIVVLLIIAFLVWLVFRGFFRAQVRGGQAPVQSRSVKGEDMVACSRCGVNLPRSEAEAKEGVFFCRDNPRCIAGP